MSLPDGDVEMIPDGNDDIDIHLDVPDTKAEKPDTARRGYSSPYTIRFTGSQRDRFPASARPEIRSMLANDNDREPYPMGFSGEWEDFPRVARMRMNLTTLSQHYDLYFIAYRGYIHVYRPNRNAKSTIQGPPLVILDPDQSKTQMADFSQGHVNPTCPHEVNHMVIGDLGEKEILLIARDNGDVVAWYTRTIAHCVEARTAWERNPHVRMRDDTSPKPPSPTHFFATNVGLSAWGLAVHTQSRLIAVSANTSEVTVFAFALEGEEDVDAQFNQMPTALSTTHEGFERSTSGLKESFRTRKRTWRIIITLGREATNIPSISFCDDANGHADRIAAIDISGHLWVAEIWTIGTRRLVVFPHNVQYPQGRPYNNVTGWNVLAISDAQLLPTKSVRAAIGLRPSRATWSTKSARGTWYDISKSMAQVKDDAAHEDHIARMRIFRREDVNGQDNGPARAILLATSVKDIKTDRIAPSSTAAEKQDGCLLAMTVLNATGHYCQEFADERVYLMYLRTSSPRKAEFQKPRALSRDEVSVHGISFLRANCEDIEMLNPNNNGCGVACHHVLPALTHDESLVPWDYHGLGKRISMLLTIPELNLVILGSMHGRVALITLTKPPQAEGNRIPSRAFRVDAVLPFQSEVRRQPWVCLLGIAISPVPETRVRGLRLRKTRPDVYGGRRRREEVPEIEYDTPKRWRLILNYQDHTILQYEITRKDAGETDRTPWEARVLRKQGLDSGDNSGGNDLDEEEEGEDDWPLPEAA